MPTDRTKRLTLALQGGGSHGAYTWGVFVRNPSSWQVRKNDGEVLTLEYRAASAAWRPPNDTQIWLQRHYDDIGRTSTVASG